MTTKISRQLRIHIEEPNNCLEYDDNIYDNKSSTPVTVAPITNRNIVHKIKSVQSIDLTQPTYYKKQSSIENYTTINIKKYQLIAKQVLELGYVQLLILIVTTWAIFGDDIRLLSLSPVLDSFFSIVNWSIMGVFIIEYTMTVFSDPQYIYTVFSVLDILSIVSMIPMENLANAAQNIIFLNADSGTVARTGRAAKVGAKAGRIVKAARFLRLGRLVMEAIDTKEAKVENKLRDNNKIQTQTTLDERPANCLSHRLSKELTVKVVIIIFLLLVVYPFLGVHIEPFENRTMLLKTINDGCMECRDPNYMDSLIHKVTRQKGLYYMKSCGKVYEPYTDYKPKRVNWVNIYTQGYIQEDLSSSTIEIFKSTLCNDVYGIHYDKSCVDALLDKTIDPLNNITAAFYDDEMYQQESLMSLFFLLFVLGLLIMSSFIISKDTDKISRLISEPLQLICLKMKNMQEFKFDELPNQDKSEIHEINELNDSFMRLQNAVISFSRYVPIPIVKNLMKSKKEASINVERRVLSIFFSDIKGFTTICENLKPSEILTLLTEYFDAMEEVVSETQGTILEYVGDAILAVWNAPLELKNHAEQSITCALTMQIKLAKLRQKWIKDGYPEIFIRVGVNTGEVFHGNIGSHNRLKYGILGDSVNLASRLEELNKRYGTELLVTNDTYRSGNVSLNFLARPVDIVVVKGKSVPTLLWEIVAIKKDSDLLAQRICAIQINAMDTFLQQEFNLACKLYDEAYMLEIQRNQKYKTIESDIRFMYNTVDHIYNRCKLLIGSPKMSDWNGSETLSEKHF